MNQEITKTNLDRVINNIPNTMISKSNVHGYGLFSTTRLIPGVVLTKLDGQKITWEVYESENSLLEEWNALPDGCLLVRPFKTKYFYINHSRTPNLTLILSENLELSIVVDKDICEGDELFLDYRKESLPKKYIDNHGATYL
ncbi:MAG: SET domain-containing protein [Pseudohongiella nitratireducens]|nr:SET domain-containing protein [Pseudohongiella nitratireducens]MDF1622013.1 SET domain-containing protein [Pseudohongiella nitratireducens]